MAAETKTGGRDATSAIDPGRYALSVGRPNLPSPYRWTWTKLTDVARLETGHTPSRKRSEYWGGDIPWIGIKDATHNDGRRIDETMQKTTALGIENSSARLLPADTVCLSRTASVGYVVVMGRPMATSQDFVNWVCDDDRLDWRFLKWALLAERQALRRWAHGTTHQTIYFPEVKAFHINLPPRSEQRAIASVVGALDDKIESNSRVAMTIDDVVLTAAARTTGRPTRLGEVAVLNRASYNLKTAPAEIDYIDISSVSPRRIDEVRRLSFDEAPSRARRCLTDGDTLISTVRPERRSFAFIDRAAAALVASTGFAVLTPTKVSAALLYAMATSDRAVDYYAAAATGSAYPAVSADAISELEIPVPQDGGAAFEAAYRPLLAHQAGLLRESRVLAELRDALLPKLVSGQIRVAVSSDPDKMVETAVEAHQATEAA
jgi:type I restriction enzyme S subunit